MESVTLPFELQAKAHEPMPDGLTAAEQAAYQAISLLVFRYRQGLVTAEQSKSEMDEIRRSVMDDFKLSRGWRAIARFMTGVESASIRYAKDKSPENAEHLYRVVSGLERETLTELDIALDGDLSEDYLEICKEREETWRWWNEKAKDANARVTGPAGPDNYDPDSGDDPDAYMD